jgi:hypothetical protein
MVILLETEQIEEKDMNNPNRARHFAIRAAKARKAEQNTIVVGGNVVQITSANARFAETVRRNDAESAYAQAVSDSLRLAA